MLLFVLKVLAFYLAAVVVLRLVRHAWRASRGDDDPGLRSSPGAPERPPAHRNLSEEKITDATWRESDD